jgi:hypothetical protein
VIVADEEFTRGVPGLERTVADDVMGRRAPSVGRIVLYTLTADDAVRIGSSAREGQEFPMIITRADGRVNGQVFPDGGHVLWVNTVGEGTSPGTWRWPPRA